MFNTIVEGKCCLTLLLTKTSLLSHINYKNVIITKCSELVIVIDFSFGDFTKTQY